MALFKKENSKEKKAKKKVSKADQEKALFQNVGKAEAKEESTSDVSQKEKVSKSKSEKKSKARVPYSATAATINMAAILTEKSVQQQGDNTIVVRVLPSASKIQIMRAVKEQFGVEALSVRTMNVRPKIRRRGRTAGFGKSWKKAYITVDNIQKLNADI